jgi:potassium channel
MNNSLGPPASPKQVDLAEMSSEKNVKHERGSWNLKGRGRLHGDVSREKNLLSDVIRMSLFESKSGNSVRVNEIGSFMVESKLPLPVLSPTDPFHEKWDIVMLILITYVAIFAPVQATFLSNRHIISAIKPWFGWFLIDQFVTLCFLCDMVVHFRTSWLVNKNPTYTDWEALLRYTGSIKKGYIGWFWVDIVSLIPFGSFIPRRGGSVRMFKLIKLTKIIRVIRVARIYQRARQEISRRIGYSKLRLITFVVLIIYCSHILSCLLYGIHDLGKDYYQDTWVWANSYASESATNPEESLFELYMIGMYWAMMTLTTVGYGDIVATNNLERTFFWFVMLISAFVFSYLLGNIIDAVASANTENVEFEAWMDELNTFLNCHELPEQLKMDTYNFAYFLQGEIDNQTRLTNHAVLEKVSPSLRRQLLYAFYGRKIQSLKYFKAAPSELIGRLCEKLKRSIEAPHQYIFREGRVADGLYIFISGEAYTSKHSDSDNSFLAEGVDDPQSALMEGDVFGFECFVFPGRPRKMSVYTRTICLMYHLSIEGFQLVMKNFPQHAAKLRSEMIKDLWKSVLGNRLFHTQLKGVNGCAEQRALTEEEVVFNEIYNKVIDTKLSRMLTKQKLRKGAEAGAVSVLENSWAALGEDEFRYSQLSKTEKLLDDVEKIKSILLQVHGKQHEAETS